MQKTDLLFGIVSEVPNKRNRHFFLADFDDILESTVMRRIGRILFDKYKFGTVYLVRTGRGWHVASFSVRLTLEEYVKILEDADIYKTTVDLINLEINSGNTINPTDFSNDICNIYKIDESNTKVRNAIVECVKNLVG